MKETTRRSALSAAAKAWFTRPFLNWDLDSTNWLIIIKLSHKGKIFLANSCNNMYRSKLTNLTTLWYAWSNSLLLKMVGKLLRVYLDTTYCWKLKTENWKHCSKITFKCVNSAMRLNFKVVFAKKSTYGSHEQCTRSTKKKHPLGNAQNALPKLTKIIGSCFQFL